jgi:zinc transporter ZupT
LERKKIVFTYFLFFIIQNSLKDLKNTILNGFKKGFFSVSKRSTQARPGVNWTTTLGLVVHAAADGIAMGAAAATHQVRNYYVYSCHKT